MERTLVIWSTVIILVISALAVLLTPEIKRIQFNTENEITYGNPSAKVHVVVFEEFLCPQCKRFHQEVIQSLFNKYIDTGKAKLTLIPIAYLDASLPAYSAACCLSSVEEKHLRGFLDHIFQLNSAELAAFSARQFLASYASKTNGLSLGKLLSCIKSDEIEQKREKMLELASAFYGEEIHMPTLLVNGRLVTPLDKEAVFATIENELLREKKDAR